MKPMLARTYGPRYSTYPCYLQPKLNGIRALSQHAVFQSRDEKIWNDGVLGHLQQQMFILQQLCESAPIFDGELYVHGWRLQDINAAVAVNRLQPTEKTPFVEYHIFDVVNPALPFSQRFLPLQSAIIDANLPHIKLVPTAFIGDNVELDSHFHHWTQHGYEGVMLRPDGKYEFGEHVGRGGNMTQYRSKTLWKYKCWEDGEFACVGVTQGEGKADIGIGALTCAAHPEDLKNTSVKHLGTIQTFNVGTGFSDSERRAFMQNPPIGKLIKVKYLCLSADGIPLNPSFLAVLG